MSNWHNEHIMQWYRRRIKVITTLTRFNKMSNKPIQPTEEMIEAGIQELMENIDV